MRNPKGFLRGVMKLKIFGRLVTVATFLLFSVSISHSQVSQTWQVEKYDIAVKHPEGGDTRAIDVIAKLKLRNIGSTSASSLTLRLAMDAEVSQAMVGGEIRDLNRSQERVGAAMLQRIQMRLAPIRPGEVIEAEVSYRLKIQENSSLSSFSGQSSQFLPLSFWYPTPNSWFFTRGADYAPTKISFSGDSRRTFLSSGLSSGSEFKSELNVQPFFVSGNWEKLEVGGAELFVQRGITSDEKRLAESILSTAIDARRFMAEKLGWTPTEKIRIISVRRGGGFSSGGTVLLDDSVLRRGVIDSQTFMSLSEAIAKMFLSDGMRITGDGHGFIREGLPRFLATRFMESKFGEKVAAAERLRQRNTYSAISSRDGAITQLSPLDDIYYNSSANKGAMIWRLFERDLGAGFVSKITSDARLSGTFSVSGIRSSSPEYSRSFTYFLDEITTGNLLAGIPQSSNGRTTVALRNTMPVAADVRVRLLNEDGEELFQQVRIPGSSFGQALFETPKQALRAEIDPDGFHIQSDYSDDVAPKRFSESDVLLLVKRAFDRQEYAEVETLARDALTIFPNVDEVRVLLARALLAQNKLVEAEKEFGRLQSAELITARSVSWLYLGLGEIAEKRGERDKAQLYYDRAVRADGELGAVLLARQGRARLNPNPTVDESLRRFFQNFDRAAISNRKSEIDALIAPGESVRFSSGIAGQAQQWSSAIVSVDRLSEGVVMVETRLSIKLLNRNQEQGTAIFRLAQSGADWRLEGIEFFDVR